MDLLDVLDRLIEKTSEKKVIWNGSSRQDQYVLHLKSSTIVVEFNTENPYEETGTISFTIYNSNAERIVYRDTADLDSLIISEKLRKLYDLARDSYFRVEETLEEIYKEIESDDIIGKRKRRSADLPNGPEESIPF